MCYCPFLLLCLLVFILCMEVLLCWVPRYLQLLCLTLGLFPWSLYSILPHLLCDTRISTPAFFCFPFAWNIFFHPLTFSLYVSLGLKWVSCEVKLFGSIRLFVTPWTVAYQAPPAWNFPGKSTGVGCHFRQHIYASCFCIHLASLSFGWSI